MKDEYKTKKQLIEELNQLRRNIVAFQDLKVPRNNTEEHLRQREAIARALLNAGLSAAYLMDIHGTILVANESAAQGLGKSVDEIVGLRMSDLLPPDVLERRRKRAVEVVSSGKPVRFEDEMRGRVFDTSIHPVRDQKGNVIQLAVYGRDITARKRAEHALRDSEEKFRKLAEELPSIIFINHKGTIVYVNERCREVMGYTRNELCGPDFDFATLIAPESRDDVMSVFKRHMKGQEAAPHEGTLITRGGRRLQTLIATKLIAYGHDRAILGIVTDITRRKQIEDTLKVAKEELEVKTIELEEANTTLKVLLKQREADERDLEERVMANVKHLILPSLHRLRKSHLDRKQTAHIAILEAHIEGIVSPFAKTLSSPRYGLTFKEIQVAELIKAGKTTKEIAEWLKISPSTVKFHRENLRRKFRLNNTRSNLRTHLFSIT